MGLTLAERDLRTMKVVAPNETTLEYEILQMFPFTSERKRMGIIVKVSQSEEGEGEGTRGREKEGDEEERRQGKSFLFPHLVAVQW